jgi:tetrahydromethanopterin S-methyltransferase subunit G
MVTYYVVAAAVIVLSMVLARRTKKERVASLPDTSRGFGQRDEKCTVVLADGTNIDTTFGEIEKKVREINGEKFWVEKKWDVLIGAVYCVIGLIATAVVYYLERHYNR